MIHEENLYIDTICEEIDERIINLAHWINWGHKVVENEGYFDIIQYASKESVINSINQCLDGQDVVVTDFEFDFGEIKLIVE